MYSFLGRQPKANNFMSHSARSVCKSSSFTNENTGGSTSEPKLYAVYTDASRLNAAHIRRRSARAKSSRTKLCAAAAA